MRDFCFLQKYMDRAKVAGGSNPLAWTEEIKASWMVASSKVQHQPAPGDLAAVETRLRDELEVWTCAWYDEAVAANFVRPPYHPDATIIKRLQGYFHAGLAPAEAAVACFGRNH
ncbi:hypothetical protein [Paraburkholderia terricola]|uniref:hypothetical protein n=1 Tax=Paraburkholderia terricola TaxID=169427 RepID=UPI000936D5E5|nr:MULTISPECIES: hypothetical protein [Paraburkholderia]